MIAHIYSGYLCAVYIVLFIFTSCDHSKSNIRDGAYFGADEKMRQETMLKLARRSLYENDLDRSDSLLHKVDSLKLSKSTLGIYYLTKGFLDYKNGSMDSSFENIETASNLISESGSQEQKAQLDLVWGLVFEGSYLLSEAEKSFYSAWNYYQDHEGSIDAFFTLLGLVRTSHVKEIFMKKAEILLTNEEMEKFRSFFYHSKALCTNDLNQQQKLFQEALKYNNESMNLRNELNLYTSMALNRFESNYSDSAFYYLSKAEKLISLGHIPESKLVHHYIIKAYINLKTDKLKIAEKAIAKAISNAGSFKGLLGEAYRQKYFIQMAYGNYESANKYLLIYINLKKEEFQKRQDYQLALLSIKYELQMKEGEIQRLNLYRYLIVMASFILVLAMTISFIAYKKKVKKLITFLKIKLSTTANRLDELIYKSEGDHDTFSNNSDNSNMHKSHVSNFKNWAEYNSWFSVYYPYFYEKLKKKHPKISPKNIRYCICFFCGLSIYDTSRLLGVSSDGVRKAKKNLQRLFGLKNVQDIQLYLREIERKVIPPS